MNNPTVQVHSSHIVRKPSPASMRPRAHWLSLALALASVAEPAAADVPPVDSCMNEGASCANAGPAGTRSGTCQSARCQRYNPVYDADGGVSFVLVEYDCLRCVEGGAGGAAGTGATAGAAGSSISGSPGMENGCHCDLPGRHPEGALAALMLAVGAASLALARRRS